jgi:hypothetical protein
LRLIMISVVLVVVGPMPSTCKEFLSMLINFLQTKGKL